LVTTTMMVVVMKVVLAEVLIEKFLLFANV
jgi:hypothetical protein